MVGVAGVEVVDEELELELELAGVTDCGWAVDDGACTELL
jgi:hypothetical protein